MAMRSVAISRPPDAPGRLGVDVARILLAGAISTVLAIVASGAFDQIEWPLLVPPLAMTIAALATRRVRLAIRVGVYVAVGITAVAVAGAWAGADDAGDVVAGLFNGPRRLLTTEWPSPADPQVIVAVATMLAIVSSVAGDLAGRRQFHLAPLGASAVGLACALAIGAPRRPDVWTLWAMAALALALLLFGHGDDVRSRLRTLAGERSLPALLVSVVIAAAASSTAVAWSDRADPRRTEDADATATVLKPIEEMIALRHAEPAFAMFEITDRSTLIGRSLPTRWRISALSEYDGQRWVPDVTLRPIGTRLGIPQPASPDQAPPIAFDIELLTDDFDVIPLPGQPLSIDTGESEGVQTDLDRTVVRLPEPPRAGTTVHVTSNVEPRIDDSTASRLASRQVDEFSADFVEAANAIAGNGTLLEQLTALESTLRSWSLDRGAPGGLQLALMERFVSETHRGTEEQFVTAFVLLARSLGFDARVATGFVVPPDELSAPLQLRSSHAGAWPEVRLQGQGWLPFDPTPVEQSNDVEPPPPPAEEQTPAAAQPPIQPPADRDTDAPVEQVETEAGSSTWSNVRAWLLRASLGGGIALAPFALAVLIIVTLKGVRRRRRLRHADPARRIVGAWANTTDALVDAGLTIGPAWTDAVIAEHAGTYVATAPHDIHRLAASATAMTFGDRGRAATAVDDAIAAATAVEHAIAAALTRWQRIRWRLSLRSLRRSTRSPVVV